MQYIKHQTLTFGLTKDYIMQTDYQITGKTYKQLEAFIKGGCSQAMPNPANWYYFGSSIQFKTCKSFKVYLQSKHVGVKFNVIVAKKEAAITR